MVSLVLHPPTWVGGWQLSLSLGHVGVGFIVGFSLFPGLRSSALALPLTPEKLSCRAVEVEGALKGQLFS